MEKLQLKVWLLCQCCMEEVADQPVIVGRLADGVILEMPGDSADGGVACPRCGESRSVQPWGNQRRCTKCEVNF